MGIYEVFRIGGKFWRTGILTIAIISTAAGCSTYRACPANMLLQSKPLVNGEPSPTFEGIVGRQALIGTYCGKRIEGKIEAVKGDSLVVATIGQYSSIDALSRRYVVINVGDIEQLELQEFSPLRTAWFTTVLIGVGIVGYEVYDTWGQISGN